MLVRLTSSTSGEVLMFAEHAHRLFEVIGKECTARGVFSEEQLAGAIAALRRAVDDERHAARSGGEGQQPQAEDDEEVGDNEPEEKVGLGQRAVPLIRLMQQTLKEKGFILWEASADF